MKIFFIIIISSLLFLSSLTYAEEKTKKIDIDELVDLILEHEKQEMIKVFKSWTDEEVIKSYYQREFTENYIKKLYQEFKETIVNPPNPDTYTEYSIPHAEESLAKVEKLGKKMHNILVAMHDTGRKKYTTLVWLMRDVLYTDWKHIPYAIKHNPARDVYWYGLHQERVEEAEKEYLRLFGGE